MRENNTVLFICNAPFQLLSAAQIRYRYFAGRPAAILLTDAAKALERYAGLPPLREIFQEVHYVKIFSEIKMLSGYDNVEHFDERVRDIVKDRIPVLDCSDVFFANLHGWIGCYLQALLAANPSIRTHYYEDGMDSYICRIGFSEENIPVADMYVYEPDCVTRQEGMVGKIHAIPPPQSSTEECKNVMRRLFGLDGAAIHLKKFIFFEQHSDSKDDYPFLDQLFFLTHGAAEGDAVLKSHPRRRYHPSELDPFRWETDIPWEVIAAQEDLEENVLVSVSSKAVFSMTNVTTCRPTVILLHHLISTMTGKPLQWWHMDDDHVALWREKYGWDRVFIPESIEQFQEIIQRLRAPL